MFSIVRLSFRKNYKDAPLLFVLFCFVLVYQDKVIFCSLGLSGTNSVDQTGLKLTEIHLPPSPKC